MFGLFKAYEEEAHFTAIIVDIQLEMGKFI